VAAQEAAYESVQQVAVESYGRLRAFVAARFGDLALAEDALSEAFVAALRTWPERGVPEQPENWLLAAARNHLRDRARHETVAARHAEALRAVSQEVAQIAEAAFPDERLRLMFVCAHPAIEATIRTPLMLQAVLGLDAARIAGAYLVPASTMGQRLSRAKVKIAAAGISFAVPEERELPERMQAVLEAIYAVYGLGWEDLGSTGLAQEALYLAGLMASLLPGEAEAHALFALLLHAEARRDARRDTAGAFVPLAEQDPDRWSANLHRRAERHLELAHRLHQQHHRRIGPFQLEAAIQSAHASRARTGRVPWKAIAALYDALVEVRPSLASAVGRAAAHGEAFGPEQGLALLDQTAVYLNRFDYQPYWACRGHLSRRAGRATEAATAYAEAIARSSDPAICAYLRQQQSRSSDA